ncbi:EcsC family protein [Nocardioides humilatus]|uniref:EcsC family protein n=1 Tax=Nocardioides humilatus TaxID=2607660 RepID=A0A5B1LHE0_9ACTN|nr:EcsC family protein [Nocardioides humilatus]KAA1419210.1 EcsC family protein [Nocardioides humilatus]
MSWSKYETRAWRDIQDRKRRWYERSEKDTWAKRTGGRISKTAGKATKKARSVPGADKAVAALGTAAVKTQEALADVSSRTLSEKRVLRAYRRRGVKVAHLVDLRRENLKALDKVVHRRRLNMVYGGLAAVEGATAGAIVTGGEALATFGSTASAGAAAAPGFGAVAAAMTGDAALVLALSSRAVADTAMHYGFDPRDPKEQLFMLSVINVGSAVTQGAKYTALADLSKLTQALVRSAPWVQLNKFALSRIAGRFAEQFGVRLTKQKLGQLVPVVGIGVGAALNYATVKSVQEAAYWGYRERLLLEKNPEAVELLTAELDQLPEPVAENSDEPSIEIAEIIASLEPAADFHGSSDDEAALEEFSPDDGGNDAP